MTYKSLEHRSIVTIIVLSFITCGIYGLYTIVKINDDVNIANEEVDTSGGIVLLFILLTCGIYTYYWLYKMGSKMERLELEAGMRASNDALLYIVLGIFVNSSVSIALIQSKINNLVLNAE